MAKAIGKGANRSVVGVMGDRFEGRAIVFASIGVGEERSGDRWRSLPERESGYN
jgi:hypothetical protein